MSGLQALLEGMKGGGHHGATTTTTTTTRLYGRDSELDTIKNILLSTACNNGAKNNGSQKAQFVFVSGECGTGKTTLIEQAIRMASTTTSSRTSSSSSSRASSSASTGSLGSPSFLIGTGSFEQPRRRILNHQQQQRPPLQRRSPVNSSSSGRGGGGGGGGKSPYHALVRSLSEIVNQMIRVDSEYYENLILHGGGKSGDEQGGQGCVCAGSSDRDGGGNDNKLTHEDLEILVRFIPQLEDLIDLRQTLQRQNVEVAVGETKSTATAAANGSGDGSGLPNSSNGKGRQRRRRLQRMDSMSNTGTGGLENLKYVLRNFLRIISTTADHQRPIVLWLDDLQWIDLSTFHLVKHLVTDPELSSNFIFIGSYRTDSDDATATADNADAAASPNLQERTGSSQEDCCTSSDRNEHPLFKWIHELEMEQEKEQQDLQRLENEKEEDVMAVVETIATSPSMNNSEAADGMTMTGRGGGDMMVPRGIKNTTGVSCHLSCALQIICHTLPPLTDVLISLAAHQQQQQQGGMKSSTGQRRSGRSSSLLVEFGHFFQSLFGSATNDDTPPSSTAGAAVDAAAVDPSGFYNFLEKSTELSINQNDVGDTSNATYKILERVFHQSQDDKVFSKEQDVVDDWMTLCNKCLFSGRTCQSIIGQKLERGQQGGTTTIDTYSNDDDEMDVVIQRTKHGKIKDMAYPFPLVGKFDSIENAFRDVSLNGTPVMGYQWDRPNQTFDETRIAVEGSEDGTGNNADGRSKGQDQPNIFVASEDEQSWVTRKSLRLEQLPFYWMLHVERFSYDEYGVKVLSNPKVEIPPCLDMSQYCKLAGSYSLRGVIFHVSDDGNIEEEGHYVAAMKSLHWEGGWILVDDESCMQLTEERVVELATGNIDEQGRFLCGTLLVYGNDDIKASHDVQQILSDLKGKVAKIKPMIDDSSLDESEDLGDNVVGRRLKIRWAKGKFYAGVVASYDPSTGKHRVRYDDGDIREYNLSKKTIAWEEKEEKAKAADETPCATDANTISNDSSALHNADNTQRVTHISLKNWSIETLQSVLEEALGVDCKGGDKDDSGETCAAAQDLAELIDHRTNGNIFHVLQFLQYLVDEKLLRYDDMTTFSYIFDVNRIRDETNLCENVVSIVCIKLYRLPEDVQQCLKLCGCLGYRFQQQLLELIVDDSLTDSFRKFMTIEDEASSDGGDDDEGTMSLTMPVKDCIQIAIDENFLERIPGDRLKFSHDKIYEATVSLLDPAERAKVQCKIGMTIKKQFGNVIDDMDNSTLFLCVDQFNLGLSFRSEGSESRYFDEEDDEAQVLELIKLNLEAAKRAAQYHAFFPAIDYAMKGVALLDTPYWSGDRYILSLELHTLLAEVSMNAGQLDGLEELIQTILDNARNTEDSLRAYFVLLECLQAKDKLDQVRERGLHLLKLLGEEFPRNPSSRMAENALQKMKKRVDEMTDDEILSLPLMTDATKVAATRVIYSLWNAFYHSDQKDLSKLFVCRMVNMTLDLGLTDYGILGFAWSAMVSEVDKDFGCRIGSLSMDLLEQLGAQRLFSMIYVMMSIVTFHWREPLVKVANRHMEGFRQGMRHGDLQAAFMNLTAYELGYFYSGLNLGPLVKDSTRFTSLMMDYGHTMQVLQRLPLCQVLQNLTGQSRNILDMSGGMAREYRRKIGWDTRAGEHAEWSYSMQLYFYCTEFDRATDMYEKLVDIGPGFLKSHFIWQMRVFFFTLIAIHNVKINSKKKRKFKQDARKYFDMFKEWVVKERAINMVHRLMILDSEMKTMEKRKLSTTADELTSGFDKAIVASLKSGFVQDAALAASLASRATFNPTKSGEYFRRSQELFFNWGAKGVVEHLKHKSKHQSLRESVIAEKGVITGTSQHSKEKFSFVKLVSDETRRNSKEVIVKDEQSAVNSKEKRT